MFIRKFGRYGALVLVCFWVAGCSSSGPGLFSPRASGTGASGPVAGSDQCRVNPRSCIHKGQYESGERAYAEYEAARLNQAELERLRRNAVR